MMKKNTTVCNKRPAVVGQPAEEAIGTNLPSTMFTNLNIGGEAISKKTRAEYKE